MKKILTIGKPAAPGAVMKTTAEEILRTPSKEIKKITPTIVKLAEEMMDYIKSSKTSVGLSAPQVGKNIRLSVISLPGIDITIINPKITKTRGMHRVTERCMSIPGKAFSLQRPKIVKVRGIGLDGKEFGVKGRDLLAQVLCHEIDHLDGILVDVPRNMK